MGAMWGNGCWQALVVAMARVVVHSTTIEVVRHGVCGVGWARGFGPCSNFIQRKGDGEGHERKTVFFFKKKCYN